jgi:6-phosphogluconolactonase
VKGLLVLALAAACEGPGQVAPPAEAAVIDAPAATRWVAYVGGYGDSIGWYGVDGTTGALALRGSIPATGASFLAFDAPAAHLYAVDETNSRVVAFAIDPTTGALAKLNDQSSGGSGPAHVTVAGDRVLVANYGDGTVSVLPIAGDGSLQPATQTVVAGAHAHEVVVYRNFAFVPCLGADYVAQYRWDGSTLTQNAVPHMMTASGAGPRHLVVPAVASALLVDETASTLMELALDESAGTLSPVQTISTLPDGFTGQNTGAEIAFRGGYVYTSNRGADDLAVFALTGTAAPSPVTFVPTGGMTPRHFSISPDGAWLYVANQGSSTVVTFAVDGSDGVPRPTAQQITAASPTFVAIAVLP